MPKQCIYDDEDDQTKPRKITTYVDQGTLTKNGY